MKKLFAVLAALFLLTIMACGSSGGGGESSGTHVSTAVVVGGTPVNSAPPVTTTGTGTPVISNLVLNPNPAQAGDRLTFSLAFTDTGADVNTFGIQFNGENKYYAYDVSGVASGNLAFKLTVQDTIGNVKPGTYQVVIFIADKLGNVSNYLTDTLTVQSGSGSAAFTQADLTGTWNWTSFDTSSDGGGYSRGRLSINSSGDIHFITYENTFGQAAPPDGAVRVTIDATGIVTESGTGAAEASHSSMSADKKTVVGVVTNGTTYSTRIMVKTTGVTFSNTDLTGPLSVNLHGITSGGSSASDREWFYGAGTINASRQVTLTELQSPEGPQTPSDVPRTLSVGADGFVNFPLDGTITKGMLSSDKKMLIYTSQFGDKYSLGIFTIADQTFSGVSALAGDWRISGLWGGVDFGWGWMTATINSSGIASMTSKLTSDGNTALDPGATFAMTSSGIATWPGQNPSFHGVLSHDRIISIGTQGSGSIYQLLIWTR